MIDFVVVFYPLGERLPRSADLIELLLSVVINAKYFWQDTIRRRKTYFNITRIWNVMFRESVEKWHFLDFANSWHENIFVWISMKGLKLSLYKLWPNDLFRFCAFCNKHCYLPVCLLLPILTVATASKLKADMAFFSVFRHRFIFYPAPSFSFELFKQSKLPVQFKLCAKCYYRVSETNESFTYTLKIFLLSYVMMIKEKKALKRHDVDRQSTKKEILKYYKFIDCKLVCLCENINKLFGQNCNNSLGRGRKRKLTPRFQKFFSFIMISFIFSIHVYIFLTYSSPARFSTLKIDILVYQELNCASVLQGER